MYTGDHSFILHETIVGQVVPNYDMAGDILYCLYKILFSSGWNSKKACPYITLSVIIGGG